MQECNKYHGAAEGDGWFEQASRPTFFGLFKQEDPMQAFCVEGGQVYLVTSWVECQVRTPPNLPYPKEHWLLWRLARGSVGCGEGSVVPPPR